MDAKQPVSLSEQDYLALIHLFHQLYKCASKKDLRICLEAHALPLFQCDAGNYGWGEIQLHRGKGKPIQGIDGFGLNPPPLHIQNQISSYSVTMYQVTAATSRTVLAHGIDFTPESLEKDMGHFFADHPGYVQEPWGKDLKNLIGSVVAIDRQDQAVVGFHRIKPYHEQPFAYRETRLMELLRPSLFHTIKRIAIQDRLQTYQALTTALGESDAPFALVQKDGRVLFRNPAFQTVVPVEPGSLLPKELRDLVEQQIALLNPDHKPETAAPPMAFYQHSDTVYRLNVTQLHQEGDKAEPAWLVRLHPADDSYTLLNRKLQIAGLTPREAEVAVLAGDGLDDADIAQRLFIASNTLKNHLKSIYKKLDVHSRIQFFTRLKSAK